MEQRYCCKKHIQDYVNLMMFGHRLTLDTNLPRGNQTRLCQFQEKPNTPCGNSAKYFLTLTARYEAPPLPESIERILDKNIEIQAMFLKDG